MFSEQAFTHYNVYCELCDRPYDHPVSSQIFTCPNCFDLLQEATVRYNQETVYDLLTDIALFLKETPSP